MNLLSHKRNKKNYVIISDNDILFTALRDNTQYGLIKYDSLLNLETIDILIIDSEIDRDRDFLFRVNVIINLTSRQISTKEIKMCKPVILLELISLLKNNIDDNSLFCSINKDWIYNERHKLLISKDREIYLTDKENNFFKEILLGAKFSTTKDHLKKTVWDHKEGTESMTIDTHIYKLKQKLPKDLLETKNSKIIIRTQ